MILPKEEESIYWEECISNSLKSKPLRVWHTNQWIFCKTFEKKRGKRKTRKVGLFIFTKLDNEQNYSVITSKMNDIYLIYVKRLQQSHNRTRFVRFFIYFIQSNSKHLAKLEHLVELWSFMCLRFYRAWVPNQSTHFPWTLTL